MKNRPKYRRQWREPLTEEEEIGLERLLPERAASVAEYETKLKEATSIYSYCQEELKWLQDTQTNGVLVPLSDRDARRLNQLQIHSHPFSDPAFVAARNLEQQRKEAQEFVELLDWLKIEVRMTGIAPAYWWVDSHERMVLIARGDDNEVRSCERWVNLKRQAEWELVFELRQRMEKEKRERAKKEKRELLKQVKRELADAAE